MMAGPSQGIPPKEATDPRSIARRAVFEKFRRIHPDIRVVNAGGLELKGDRAESGFLMSMAGDTAPDVFYVNFRQYYNYIDQGFCRPLDDLIARDPKVMARANPTVTEVLKSYDGKIYAIPWFQVAIGMYYRKDYFIEAGLDPNKPPRTWDEFYEYGKKLTDPAKGRSGFAFSTGMGGRGYHWSNFVWQAGGEIVEPAERGLWKAAIATPETAKALEFYRKLVSETWTGPDGKPRGPVAALTGSLGPDINDGKVAMWLNYTNDVVLNMTDINPALLGVAALPAGPAGRRNEVNAGMWAINATITNPKKLEACWKFINFFAGDDAARINTQRFVEAGLGALVNPVWLKKFGYEDLIADVDPAFIEANEQLFKTGHPEPYGRNIQQVYVVLDTALDRAKLEPDTPAMTILQDVAKEMDQKLLGYIPDEVIKKQRAWAAGVLTAIVLVLLIGGFFAIRKARKLDRLIADKIPAGSRRHKTYRFMIWCLMPASLTILVWAYYPLFRGLVIAFQDYRVIGGSKWVGFDNFIAVFSQPIFWKSLMNSFIYVALSIGIGFVLPIVLALALNEIPRAKVLFRTLFYLPAMMSPIVVAFLWRQFYEKTETGLLNALLSPFIYVYNGAFSTAVGYVGWHPNPIPHAIDWLGNPSLAMFAVVLPGIWAGAGPGSILYLAALKNIPEERYEAADIDGASWWQKIWWITMPGLKPLILINLLGIFIAGFKAMENIFVLTGGGPLYSTHTVGLEVWTNAFMFLKFGYATAAAWVMGSILIGFTVLQIRNLLNMRFTSSGLAGAKNL